ncbi:hypothetical protein ABT095_23615 [Kitasatospora sp. NPDC002227]|uniref:hypothetical protein n=1 Tax=Kitasatospora sp. NPDC002227 TaxID=3154773 RepID=UPI00331E7E91
MREEAPRAAFFDVALLSWESFEAARAAVDRHRAVGDLLVLVTPGPGQAAPGRTSQDGATVGELLAGGGDWTRAVLTSGADRSCAVVETMLKLGVEAFRCFGYADHHEALRTLGLVGNPRVLGDDPRLLDHARAQGWPVVSAAAPSAS